MINKQDGKRPRILVLTSTFPRWRGDHEPPFVYELSKRLGMQFDVVVLAPHSPGAMRHEKWDSLEIYRFSYFFTQLQTLAYNGGILANLKKNRLNYLLVPFFILAQLLTLLKLLKKYRVDVIHAHWIIPQGLLAVLARHFTPCKPAVICSSHGSDLFALHGTLFNSLKRFVLRHAEKTTVVSHAMRDYAAALCGRHDIDVLPMGADLKHVFCPNKEGLARACNEILFAGRLSSEKGVHHLISAAPAILERHPSARFYIAGNGPELPKLQALAMNKGIASHIHFLGSVTHENLAGLYNRASVLVLPSEREGFGLVLVEALGCECPVVASDLPAIRDIIDDKATGLLFRPKDSAVLAEKIIYLLSHPDIAAGMGVAGRRHVLTNFDWQAIACRYAALINELAVRNP